MIYSLKEDDKKKKRFKNAEREGEREGESVKKKERGRKET